MAYIHAPLDALNAHPHPTERRRDIDLLRAIAVLAVIFFHFDVPGFAGGFLGVDIFFVISGYLITLHIRTQLRDGSFSLPLFYIKRIRRLFPALAVTLVASSVAAIYVLPGTLLREYAGSLLATSLYVSNVFFLSISGYFDQTAFTSRCFIHGRCPLKSNSIYFGHSLSSFSTGGACIRRS